MVRVFFIGLHDMTSAKKLEWQKLTVEERDQLCKSLNKRYGTNSYGHGHLPFLSLSKALLAVKSTMTMLEFLENSLARKLDDQWDDYFLKRLGLNADECREAKELLRETRGPGGLVKS